jgi:hypothetical protein
MKRSSVDARSPGVSSSTQETVRPARSGNMVTVGLRWLPAVLFGAVLLFVVRLAATPLTNMDTYFHLRFGSEFLHGDWSLWHPGSVSTLATADWVPTQWLPEVVMAQVEQWFGLAGVAWLSGLQQVGFVIALYLVCRRWAEPLLVTILLIPTLGAASIGLSMRPQVLSYILLTVTVGAWLRTLDDGEPRWWLIPLTWLWGMLHGMWPIGIGLGVVGVVGLAADRRTDARGIARAAAVPVASAVAAALTPVGPALYSSLLGVGDRAQYFSEWKSPSYPGIMATVVLLVMLAVCALLHLQGPRRPWSETLFLLVAGGCALWSYRTVPVAAIILMGLIARAGQERLPRAMTRLRRGETLRIVGAAVASLIVLALLVPQTSARPPAEPAWLDADLSALAPGTVVVSDWGFGGYLMWRFPGLNLMMHGYGDTFTLAELQRNGDILTVAPGWDSKLRATHAAIAVLPPSYRLAYALEHFEGWRVVDRSSSLEMLTAPPGWDSSTR